MIILVVLRISLLSICILIIVAKLWVLLSVGKHLMAGSSSNRSLFLSSISIITCSFSKNSQCSKYALALLLISPNFTMLVPRIRSLRSDLFYESACLAAKIPSFVDGIGLDAMIPPT